MKAPGWWRRPRWYELVPEIVVVAALTWFLVDEPDAATSAFASMRAIVLMVVVGALWLVARYLAGRFVPWPAARLAGFGVAALVILRVVVLPAYDDTTVVETFPTTPPAAATDTTPTVTTPDAPTTTAPRVAEPERISMGALMGIDHRASGSAAVYRDQGRYVVGLENIDIQPGPDYDVYLVPGADQRDKGGGTRLDDLRGNKGTQYYDVPAELKLAGEPWTLLVWCQTFGVPVANASLV